MQSAVRILTILLLSTVLIVPAPAFQTCCCHRADESEGLSPCCIQARQLAKGGQSSDGSQTNEKEPHRCPCVKEHQVSAVQGDRVTLPAAQDDLVVLLAPHETKISRIVFVATADVCDTGPPLRVIQSVWRI